MSEGYQRLVELLADAANADSAAIDYPIDRPYPGAAARLYSERRRRERWFGPRLFWEPSWDILLYLYAAHEDGDDLVSVAQLADLDIAVSADSVARWIALLRDQKLVSLGVRDGAASLSLTQHGLLTMSGYLRTIAPSPALMDRPGVE